MSFKNVLIVYYLLWISLYSVWLIWGIKARSAAKQLKVKKSKSRLLCDFLLLFSLSLIAINSDNFFFRNFSNNFIRLFGVFVIFLGGIIAIWARLTLSNNWSGKVQIFDGQKMINKGLYRFVRHPIYLGFSLCFLGSLLFRFNYASLLAFLIMIPLHIIKAKQEEKLLIQEFKGEYPEYLSKTKRLLPFIY